MAENVETEFDGFDFVPSGSAETQSDEVTAPEESTPEVKEEETHEEESNAEEGGNEEAAEEGSEESEEVLSEESPAEEDPEEAQVKALAEEVKKQSTVGPSAKKLKAKKGDQVIEIDEDVVFDQKVDGEVKQVTQRQLLDSYASSQANHKQYRQFENERRAWNQQVQQFNGVIDGFTKKVKEGAVVPAIMDLIAAVPETNPLEVVRALREGLATSAKEFIELTPEQRQIIYEREEAEWLRQQNQKYQSLESSRRREAELERTVTKVIGEFGIPDRETFMELIPETQEYVRRALEAEGRSGDVQITPEMIGKYYRAKVVRDSFEGALAEQAPHVKPDSDEYRRLADVVIKNGLGPEAAAKLVKQVYGKGVSQNRRAEQEHANGSSKPGAKKTKRADIESVDPGLDIDATPKISDSVLSEIFG